MTHVPRLFCFCGGEMKNTETGAIVEVRLEDQDDRPYYKISCDRIECVDCGSEVLLTASEPATFPYLETWESFRTKYEARLRG